MAVYRIVVKEDVADLDPGGHAAKEGVGHAGDLGRMQILKGAGRARPERSMVGIEGEHGVAPLLGPVQAPGAESMGTPSLTHCHCLTFNQTIVRCDSTIQSSRRFGAKGQELHHEKRNPS